MIESHLRKAFVLSAVAVLVVVLGCSHSLEIDLPAGFAGRVSIFCERIGSAELAPIKIGADGSAPHAACPRSRQAITVLRNGQLVHLVDEPHWSTTGDGIVLGIDFEVR